MINIRSSVFETNSSSTHSLTLVEEEILESNFPKDALRSGVLRVNLIDYVQIDSSRYRYYTVANKLGYMLTVLSGGIIEIEETDPLNATKSICEGSELARDIIEKIWSTFGVRVEIVPDNGVVEGYAVYESLIHPEKLFDDVDQAVDFIVSKNSFVQIRQDYSIPEEFVDSDIGKVRALNFYAKKGAGEIPVDVTIRSDNYGSYVDFYIDRKHGISLDLNKSAGVWNFLQGIPAEKVVISGVSPLASRKGSDEEKMAVLRDELFSFAETLDLDMRLIEGIQIEGTIKPSSMDTNLVINMSYSVTDEAARGMAEMIQSVEDEVRGLNI